MAVLIAGAASGLIAGAAGLSAGQEADPLSAVNSGLAFAAVGLHLYAIAIGADAIAGEFARGTISASFSVVPRRGLLLAAKALTTCGAVVVLGLLAGILAGGLTLIVAALSGQSVGGLAIAAWLVGAGGLALGAGILSLLALSLGALSRQRLVAVLVPIVAQYVLPLLIGLLPTGATHDWVYAALPSTALTAMATAGIRDGVLAVGMIVGHVALQFWGALLVLAAWSALVAPGAVITFLRRDLSAVSAARTRAPRRTGSGQSTGRGTYRTTIIGLLRSELRKSWSLPSVRWIIAIAILVMLAYGIARAASGSLEHVADSPAEALSVEFSFAITGGVGGLGLLLAVLAAIQIAGEFESGTAVSTFIAAPRRWQVTASKLLVAALSSAVVAIPGLVLTALIIIPIYAARGYPATSGTLAVAALVAAKALLFLLLIALTSAGIAGLSRSSVTTVAVTAVLLVIGPALFNTVRGFAAEMHSPLAVIGNIARLLPWEGARFYSPPDGITAFAEIDSEGGLVVSAGFGITMTALWAIVMVIAWFAADARRPIVVR